MKNTIRIFLSMVTMMAFLAGFGIFFVQAAPWNYVDGVEVSELSTSQTIYLPFIVYSTDEEQGYHPGQTLIDVENDVSLAAIDVIALHSGLSQARVSASLAEESLQATFDLRDVPSELVFDRVGVPQNALEYQWTVYVDIDNNPDTGSGFSRYKGAEYSLGAMHFVSSADTPVSRPIPNGVQVNTWQYNPDTYSWRYLASATLVVDAEMDTMTLTGNIPGITSESRLLFVTFDYNPGGASEWDISSD